MAVDVWLERTEKTPWGFRLIGGADYDIPLTIAKVQPASLAERSGLHDGDVLIEINGVTTSSMTHDVAYDHITQAGDALLLEVTRGHPPEVPVSEFQPIPMQDFVPLSQPYEVSNDRSRSASPFIVPAKPYRPFSTEPIPDIPPVEDPIILNPNYHDDFVRVEDEDYLPETKFKLPISEQYVPDKKNNVRKNMSKKSVNSASQHLETAVDSVQYMEEMRRKIDINEIEKTVSNIVCESIEKAVAVKEEIKKKVDNEIREISTSNNFINNTLTVTEFAIEEAKSVSESKLSNITNKTIDIEASCKLDELTNYMSEESITHVNDSQNYEITYTTKQNEADHSQNVSKQAKVRDDSVVESFAIEENEIKKSKFEEMDVNIELEKLSNAESTSEQVTRLSINQSKESNANNTSINKINDKAFKALSSQNNQKSQVSNATSKNIRTSNLLAEQRAYTLGLQTIPNIRGHVHSSYHYDLLLKTFFIHLTDVMVALSRFILAEPLTGEKRKVLSGEQEIKTTSSTLNKETVDEKMKDQFVENYDIQGSTPKCETEQIDMQIKKELIENKKLSGSKLAQMSARKPIELTEKMDAVISEFQQKSQIETVQHLEVSRDKRSRSRSIIEEEVAEESDPLEWLEKYNQNSKFKSNVEINSKDVSESTISLTKIEDASSLKLKKIEENKTLTNAKLISKHEPNKVIYVATVEAHVYTKPDAIFEDMVDISEETVIQSVESTEMNNVIKSKLTACEAEYSQEVLAKEKHSAVNEESYQSIQDITIDTENIQNDESTKFIAGELVQEEVVEGVQEEAIERVQEKAIEKVQKEIIEIVHEKAIESIQEEAIERIEEEVIESVQKEELERVQEKSVERVQKEEIERVQEQLAVEIDKEYKDETVEFHTKSNIKVDEDINVENLQCVDIKEKAVKSIEKAAESFQESLSSTEEVTKLEETSETHIEDNLLSIEEHTSVEAAEIQESTFTAKLSSLKAEATESKRKLSLIIDNNKPQQNFETQMSVESDGNDSTPVPSTVPPTPLTDEYVFRLEIPLPKSRSNTPAPREGTPSQEEDHEDPNIVKKKLIPHIEVTIESVVYDKPLDSPASSNGELALKNCFEIPTIDGAAEEEDLLEIERKSSLLALAIDDTIKSIEMYKEEVGIQNVLKEGISTETKDRKRIEFEETIEADVASTFEKASSLNITEATTQNEIQNENGISTESKSSSIDAKNAIPKSVHENSIVNVDGKTLKFMENNLANGSIESRSETVVNVENDLSRYIIESTDMKDTDTFTKSSEKCYELLETVEEAAIQKSFDIKSEPTSSGTLVFETMVGSEDRVVAEQGSANDDIASSKIIEGVLGTTQGIINGIESEGLIDEEIASLGKPGMTEDEIAELISGESEMLREAHVMGLQRVLASHMNRRDDDSSVDFKKIKPTIDSLKDSEVLKVLNEDLTKTKAEKKAEERRWTTFLQRPRRPVPKARFGYYRNISNEEDKPEGSYQVKIVKQPKPKVAPDYKPQGFETGPLPWEERAEKEPPPPPIPKEEPILVPEEAPQYLEAVDPLPESEVPDLEDTGIPLPPEKEPEHLEIEHEVRTVEGNREETSAVELEEEEKELDLEKIVEETEQIVEEMEQTKLADQILRNIQSMVDPSAPLDQKLSQMRAQLAALTVLPGVIQHTLELVTNQLAMLTEQDSIRSSMSEKHRSLQCSENIEAHDTEDHQEHHDNKYKHEESSHEIVENGVEEKTHALQEVEHSSKVEAKEDVTNHIETAMLVEEHIIEKQKEQTERKHIEQESRQQKQRPKPRAEKPKPVFGPLTPQERPLVLPGGRKWRTPKDAYNDEFIAETLNAQAEIIQGKAKGLPYESALLAYDESINFKKYEKPPVSLDHLKNSEVYKVVHEMDDTPLRRVDLLTPAIAESDYREKCRSVTPSRDGSRLDAPQQMRP